MKKRIALILAVAALFSTITVTVGAVPGTSAGNLPEVLTKNAAKVYIFGGKDSTGSDVWTEFKFTKNASYVDNGILCVPLRSGIFEVLGFESAYDWISKECIVRTTEQILSMTAWKYKLYDQGVLVDTSDAYAAILCNVAYVPLVPFLKALNGITVTEDKDVNAIYIS